MHGQGLALASRWDVEQVTGGLKKLETSAGGKGLTWALRGCTGVATTLPSLR